MGRQIEQRGRADVISASLANRSGVVLTRDLAEAIELANDYAPEHLCLAVRDPWAWPASQRRRRHLYGRAFLRSPG